MRALLALALVVLAGPALADPPLARPILEEAGYSEAQISELKAGKMVTRSLDPSNDRELTAGLAFLVRVPPNELMKETRDRILVEVDPNTDAWGALEGDASAAAFASLKLGPDLEKAYRKAEPGSDLNLSKDEIEALRSHTGSLDAAVRDQVRERYRAYRAEGLGGIAPYDRGDGESPAGGDLRSATEALTGLDRHVPEFRRALLDYPKQLPEGFEERFDWSLYQAHGSPVILLTHRMGMPAGSGWVVAQRQFYVSASYNVEQAIAAFLPVSEGTLVLYQNRTSTDQVAGFGGSAKRKIGGKLMAAQLSELFDALRKAAENE